MNVVGLDGQFQERPPLFTTNLFNECVALLGNGPRKHRLAPFWAPDKVVDHEMYAMLITLIVKIVGFIGYVNIHIYSIAQVFHKSKGESPRETRLTTATKVAWLAAGSYGHSCNYHNYDNCRNYVMEITVCRAGVALWACAGLRFRIGWVSRCPPIFQKRQHGSA
jgi:hypothetical protein